MAMKRLRFKAGNDFKVFRLRSSAYFIEFFFYFDKLLRFCHQFNGCKGKSFDKQQPFLYGSVAGRSFCKGRSMWSAGSIVHDCKAILYGGAAIADVTQI